MKIRLVNNFVKILLINIFVFSVSLYAQEKSNISYNLSAQINPEQKFIIASAKISFPSRIIDAGQKVYLKLGSPENTRNEKIQPLIKRISDAQGVELKTDVQEIEKILIVYLSSRSQDKLVNNITIEYSVPFSNSYLQSLGYYLYPSHGVSNYWYPVALNEKKQNIRFADYEVSINFPKNYEVLTSGLRLNKEQIAPDLLKARFAANQIEGFSLAFGENYQLQDVEKDGIRVSALSSAELSTKFLEIAKQTADAAAWYQKTYGFFPTKNIGVIPGSKGASGGYPFPNLFMIHQGRLYSDFTLEITAHELGHYYWGLYVFDNKDFLDWLTLANGIWIDHLYLAERTGSTLEAQWRGRNRELFNWFEFYRVAEIVNYDQRLDINGAEADALDYDYNSYVRHAKGAVALYLQAKLLGKDKFLALQKRILSEYRHRQLSTEDFIRLLTEFGSPDAAEFFKVWQRGDAHIGYKIEGVEKTSVKGNTLQYSITIKRTGNVPHPVEIEIRDATDKKNRLIVSGLKDTEKLDVMQSSAIVEVRLDPDGVLPMWNSANDEIQAINIRAMFRAGVSESAIILATNYLKRDPNDEITRSMLVDELVKQARYREVLQMLAGRRDDSCNDRPTCLSLINLVVALSEEGKLDQAKTILNKIHVVSQEFGLERRWQTINTKINGIRK